MAQSVQDILLAVRNARRCEHCSRLLFPSSDNFYTCGCSQGVLVPAASILNPQGQKAALLAAGEVSPGSFSQNEQHMAFIATLPTAQLGPSGIFIGDKRVKKKCAWTRKYKAAAGEVVAINRSSAIPAVWVFEVI